MPEKKVRILSIIILIVIALLITTSLLGLLLNQKGITESALTLDGREIKLYGQGTYSNHSLVRATTYKGADLAIILFVVPILIVTDLLKNKYPKLFLIQSGALMITLYYSISLAFGAAFNDFFLIYIALFSLSLSAFTLSIYLINKSSWSNKKSTNNNLGTSIFLFLAGGSALIWLSLIIPALITGNYSEFIDINTTEPTFILDIGLIFPLFIACGISLLKKREFGYRFTPVLLTFYTLVGLMVILQTFFQNIYDVHLTKQQFVSLIVSFAILGAASFIINVYFMKNKIQTSPK
jgi:hypothetical protein